MIDTAQQHALLVRIRSITGDVTLRLLDGSEVTGTATTSTDGTVLTVTAGAVVWTVPLTAVLAVGGAA